MKILITLLILLPIWFASITSANEVIELQKSLETDYSVANNTIYHLEHIYKFSNEWSLWYLPFGGFYQAVDQIKALKPDKGNRLNVAVLVGHSSIHALFEGLAKQVDLVVVIDYSFSQISYQKLFVEAFISSSPCGYEWLKSLQYSEKQFLDTILEGSEFDREQYIEDYKEDKRLQGPYHPFASNSSYVKHHHGACRLKFSYIPLNLADSYSVEQLGRIFKKHNAVVRVFNASNAYEWVAMDLLSSDLSALYPVSWPIDNKMLFIYSRFFTLYSRVHTRLIDQQDDRLAAFGESSFSTVGIYMKAWPVRVLVLMLALKDRTYNLIVGEDEED